MLESRGIRTVTIGLVRPHMETTRPPRGVWVPFPLGRPLGEPENPAFQRRVLLQALRLVDRAEGPVILEDFPEDAPSMRDTARWMPQVVLPDRAPQLPIDAVGWSSALHSELKKVIPHWEAARHRFGRTTVGLSRLTPAEWPAYAAQFLAGNLPASPVAGLSPALVLRYLSDDLKALYGEAVQAIGPQPSPAHVNRWFWGETIAADLLRALRTASTTSPNDGFKTVGGRFLVPGPYVAKSASS